MFTLTLYLLLLLASLKRLSPETSPPLKQTVDSANAVYSTCSRRQYQLLDDNKRSVIPPRINATIFSVALLLAGDIQINPGPGTKSVYPCGVCEDPVTWNCRGVACDNCNIWYHGSCMELCTKDFELLNKSNIQWHCHKCDTMNCDSFTFRSFSLNCTNFYSPLSDIDLTFESINSVFSPLKTSSPAQTNRSNNTPQPTTPRRKRPTSNSWSSNPNNDGKTKNPRSNSSNLYNLPTKNHLRILTVNCQRITNKKAELESAIKYIKPDIVSGTESWLNHTIRSSEVFPSEYTVYRKDRSKLGGGVFLLIHKDIISSEETELKADCETIWARIKLLKNKDLILGTFYMPHRNDRDLNELNKVLSNLANKKDQKHTVLTGDFNCPDVNWEHGFVKTGAPERSVQQTAIDITTNANLVQVHTEATRQKSLLDLVFTSNPSLVRSSITVPGIADHDMVVTDIDTKPHYVKQQKRKCYIFSRAN